MLEFNSGLSHTQDKNSNLYQNILDAFDLQMNGDLNFFNYIQLRNFNNAYDICLLKDKQFSFKNFPVAIHMINKNL
jgi:hypothetical protein